MSTDLSELFERDPLKLTNEDIEVIVTRMRQAQAQYELGAKAPVAERAKKPKASEKLLKELGIGGVDLLKDLGL
jgi:hypothetical protein